MKADLVAQLKEEGLQLHSFNKNHYCFSAVVTNGTHFAYISISDVRWSKDWAEKTLYRKMSNDKDWTGGQNHYCEWNSVARKCRELFYFERAHEHERDQTEIKSEQIVKPKKQYIER